MDYHKTPMSSDSNRSILMTSILLSSYQLDYFQLVEREGRTSNSAAIITEYQTRNVLVLQLINNYHAAVEIQRLYRGFRERNLRVQPDGFAVSYSLYLSIHI